MDDTSVIAGLRRELDDERCQRLDAERKQQEALGLLWDVLHGLAESDGYASVAEWLRDTDDETS